uniref:Endonuclease/exonuclease/phosphatase domain-containing protein n=1 Tax=Latimeria chalumnae TaxID=7897 RepID=H3AFP9_LATCH
MHLCDESRAKIPGFKLYAFTGSPHHGITTYVKSTIQDCTVTAVSTPQDDLQWHIINVQGLHFINVYKPPPVQLQPITPPTVYMGDFNCQHTDWGYNYSTANGEALCNWASQRDLTLFFNSQTFHSSRWSTFSNPDLTWWSGSTTDIPTRSILGCFPHSHHRPVLLKGTPLLVPTPSLPAKRWNFCKVDWDRFSNLTDDIASTLPPPDSTDINNSYLAFCNGISAASNSYIPWGIRKTFIPGWDPECKHLYDTFRNAPNEEEASNIASQLNKTQKTRWQETVESINFTHSSQKAWQTINHLTGKSAKQEPYPVTPDDIARTIINNGKYPHPDRAFSRLANAKLKEARHMPSADLGLTQKFSSLEFKTALGTLKHGKAPGPNNVHPEQVTHASPLLQDWLRHFMSHCLATAKFPHPW